MRLYSFFILFVLKLYTSIAPRVEANQLENSGVEPVSEPITFAANESEDDPEVAGQSLDNKRKGTIATHSVTNEERNGANMRLYPEEVKSFNLLSKSQLILDGKQVGLARIEELLAERSGKGIALRNSKVSRVKDLFRSKKALNAAEKKAAAKHQAKVDTLLGSILTKINPDVDKKNVFDPVTFFSKLRFTHADLNGGLITAWLKYFYRHKIEGSQSGEMDPILVQYEAFDMLMKIGETKAEDLLSLFQRAASASASDTKYKSFCESMYDLARRESQSSIFFARKGSNTPEDFYKELNIKAPGANLVFFQWLRYCQRYEQGLKDTVDAEIVYGSVANKLLEDKSYNQIAKLIKSLSKVQSYEKVANDIELATRMQKAKRMVDKGYTPEIVYNDFFPDGTNPAEHTDNFFLLLEFAEVYKAKNGYTTENLVTLLTKKSDEGQYLMMDAHLLEKAESWSSPKVKETVNEALELIFQMMSTKHFKLSEYAHWYNSDKYFPNLLHKYYDYVAKKQARMPIMESTST
ncbi:hypothetical protein Plhal304r1_c082g0167171 [Plasmopara halstedii]